MLQSTGLQKNQTRLSDYKTVQPLNRYFKVHLPFETMGSPRAVVVSTPSLICNVLS